MKKYFLINTEIKRFFSGSTLKMLIVIYFVCPENATGTAKRKNGAIRILRGAVFFRSSNPMHCRLSRRRRKNTLGALSL